MLYYIMRVCVYACVRIIVRIHVHVKRQKKGTYVFNRPFYPKWGDIFVKEGLNWNLNRLKKKFG